MNHFIQQVCPAERQFTGQDLTLSGFVRRKRIFPDKTFDAIAEIYYCDKNTNAESASLQGFKR